MSTMIGTPSEAPAGRAPIVMLATATVLVLLLSVFATAQEREEEAYRIEWRGHTFYTDKPMPAMPRALTLESYPISEEGYYFVQFEDKVTPEMKAAVVAAGGTLFNYLPVNTYIVKMDAEARMKVSSLGFVQWVGIYQPAMRLSRELIALTRGEEPEVPKPPEKLEFKKPGEERAEDEITLTIETFKGESLDRISRAVSDAGGKIVASDEGKRRSRLRVTVSRDRIFDLARISGVLWIHEYIAPEVFNDVARGIMNVSTDVWNTHGLQGNNQIIGIADTGLDSGVNDASMHDDIEGRIISIISWPVQPVGGVPIDDGATDLNSGHGTHVSGSVLGDGTISGGNFSGVAPQASVFFQAVEQFRFGEYSLSGIPIDLNDLFQEAYDSGTRIHTNSWGAPNFGGYNNMSEDVDEFVWNNPDMLILYAAGNDGSDVNGDSVVEEGSVGAPGTAKNCLTVGATENDRAGIPNTYSPTRYGPVIATDRVADDPDGMAAFSGRGPTDENRIKPDVVAPGTMIVSVRSQASPNTVWYSDDVEGGAAGWNPAGTWARVNTDSHSGTWSWHDSPGGNYVDGTNISVRLPDQNISGGGLGSKSIQLWCRYEMGSGDEWRLEVSDDGVSWAGISFPGIQDWELTSIGLGPYSNEANLRIRFRLISDADGNTGDGLYIDDVRIVEGAFGHGLLSDFGLAVAGSPEDANYLLMGGTSMATPLMAGAAAIVRQYYAEVENLQYISAALIRATLINGVVEISPGQYGVGATREIPDKPNNVEGWGRVDLENSIFPDAPAVLDHVDELAGFSATNEEHFYELHITDGSVPAVITMVYHDYPGATLQNNLDMTINPPGGGPLYPNGLTTPDTQNNVEQIVIPAPAPGIYTISIKADDIQYPSQPYALVTSAGGTLSKREPVDVMLVLDISGSMLAQACPGCEAKLEVLKQAVELFVSIWTAVAAPGDRLGVNYFRTSIDEHIVGGDVLLPVQPNAADIIADVNGQTTTWANLTAMGGGLQAAINRLVDADRPRNIILFTDGMQNVNPKVMRIDDSPPPGEFHLEIAHDLTDDDYSNINPEDPPRRLDDDLDIKVNTIGVGASEPYMQRLTEISEKTGGLSKHTIALDYDLRRFFVEDLIDALRHNSPQLLAYRYGKIAGETTTETFTVNDTVRRVVLVLSWKKGTRMWFSVEKDGVDISKAGRYINGGFYSIYSLGLPARFARRDIEAGGDWSLHIHGGQGAAYEAAAIVDEVAFDFEFSTSRMVYLAGTPIALRASLRADGLPITNADKVTATIMYPKEGVANLLSVLPMPSQSRQAMEKQTTLGQIKFTGLIRNEAFYQRIQPISETVSLNSNGDGTYSGSFDRTDIPGTYTIVFMVEGKSPGLGKYRRTEVLSTMVRFGKAERSESEIGISVVDKAAAGWIRELVVRPKDRFGNYLGPDYGNQIKVTASPGSVDETSVDHGDGSYTFRIITSPDTDPVISIRVMGERLFEGAASEITRERRRSFSAHVGATFPVGTFGSVFDRSYCLILDADYRLTRKLTLVGYFGYNNFSSALSAIGDIYIINISANLKYRFPSGGTSNLFPYLQGGGGYYIIENGSNNFGFNLGGGLDVDLTNKMTFEAGLDYHKILDVNIEFWTSHVGLIFKF